MLTVFAPWSRHRYLILLQTTSGKTNIFIEGSMFLLLGLGFINCLNYFDNFWLLINVSFLLFRVLLFTPIFPKFCQVRFSSRENKKKRSILEADLAIRSSIPGIMYNNQASEILVSKAMFDMSQYWLKKDLEALQILFGFRSIVVLLQSVYSFIYI